MFANSWLVRLPIGIPTSYSHSSGGVSCGVRQRGRPNGSALLFTTPRIKAIMAGSFTRRSKIASSFSWFTR